MATNSNNKSVKAKSTKPEPAPVAKAPVKPAVKPAAKTNEPTSEEIGVRAFEIYVSEGCQEGNELDNWLRAEKELRSQGRR